MNETKGGKVYRKKGLYTRKEGNERRGGVGCKEVKGGTGGNEGKAKSDFPSADVNDLNNVEGIGDPLWLRYPLVSDEARLAEYRSLLGDRAAVVCCSRSSCKLS